MLVREEIVKRWYRTESPVYKNFAFLFDNPLWQKPIPKGFTVCPYFWLSLFSRVILQPLVWLIVNLFQPLIKLFGAPVGSLDAKLRRLWVGKMFPHLSSTNGAGLMLTMVGVAITIVVTGLLVLCGVGYVEKIHPFHRGRILFWEALIALVTLIGCKAYKSNKPSGCNPYVYLYGWLLLSAIVSVVTFHVELAVALHACGGALASFFAGLCWLFKALGTALLSCLLYAPFGFYIPWWAYIVAPLLFVAFVPMASARTYPTQPGRVDIFKPRKPDYKIRWLRFLSSLINEKIVVKRAIRDGDRTLLKTRIHERALESAYYLSVFEVIRRRIEPIAESLKEVYFKYPNKYVLEAIKERRDLDDSWHFLRGNLDDMIGSRFNNAPFDALDQISYESLAADLELNFKNSSRLQAEFKDYVKSFEARSEWKKKLDETCQAWTAFLADLITIPAEKLFNKAATGATVIVTFLAYLWTLIVAKKKGACPYFQFEETKEDENKH